MFIVNTLKRSFTFPQRSATSLLWVIFLLIACGSDVGQDRAGAPMKFSVPGGAPLLRVIDASTVQATLTWRLDNDADVFGTIDLTRVGQSDEWRSDPLLVTPGEAHTVRLTWAVIADDGNPVIYAHQDISFTTTDTAQTIDLSGESYQFDSYDHDNDGVSNFNELLAETLQVASGGTTTSSAPEFDPDLARVSITLDSASTEPPANVDGAAGNGGFEVNTFTGAVSGSVTISGTTGVPISAHIHVGAVGEAGPVLVPLQGSEDSTVWTVPDGEALDAVGIAAFEAGDLYVNVHTEANPRGELRAQLVADATAEITGGMTTEPTVGSLTISFRNTSVSMPMTPPVVVLHNARDADNGINGIRLFKVGQPAFMEIVEIAENGDNIPLVAYVGAQIDQGTVSAAGIAFTDAENPGPLLPGASASVNLDLANDDQVLTVVSMIACSNDGFSGIDSRALSADATETFMAPIYDAGSETNVENLDYWVEDCGGTSNRGDDENGSITAHPGQSEAENADFNFDAGAEFLEITVTRN